MLFPSFCLDFCVVFCFSLICLLASNICLHWIKYSSLTFTFVVHTEICLFHFFWFSFVSIDLFFIVCTSAKMFNRSCYLLIVSIVSSRCLIRMNVTNASLSHHVWLGFYVQWPAILSVDYRGIFANSRIRPEFQAPKMERLSEFDGSRLHESLN